MKPEESRKIAKEMQKDNFTSLSLIDQNKLRDKCLSEKILSVEQYKIELSKILQS